MLGWEYTGGEPEFGGYLTVTRERPAWPAGMGPQQDPDDPPRWTTYFAADDAAATAARIKDAGGTVLVEPMEVGPMGTMVIALDPQGNPFGLWQSGLNTGVRDPQRARRAGLERGDGRRHRGREDVLLRRLRVHLRQMRRGRSARASTTPPSRPAGTRWAGSAAPARASPKGWLTCFAVSSTDEAVAAVEANGGTVTMPAMDTPFGRFAIVEDPWGAPFEVMGPTAG